MFHRNKHMMCDFGTGNNNKINWVVEEKQELIDIFETVYAVGEYRSKLRMEPALNLQGVDFDRERAADVSRKLDNLLEPLRERIAEAYPETVAPSPETHQCDAQNEEVQDCSCQQSEENKGSFLHAKRRDWCNASAWWD